MKFSTRSLMTPKQKVRSRESVTTTSTSTAGEVRCCVEAPWWLWRLSRRVNMRRHGWSSTGWHMRVHGGWVRYELTRVLPGRRRG